MLALTECGIQLCGEAALLGGFLLLQFGNRRVHLINLFIQLIERVLRFAQLTGGFRDRFFLLFQLSKQAGALLLLLAYRALFRGDICLNRFELVTLIRVGGKGAQQYASAKNAGVDDGPDCKPARFHGPCHGINRLSPHGEGLFHDEQRLTSHLLRDFHTHQRQHGRRDVRKFAAFNRFHVLITNVNQRNW